MTVIVLHAGIYAKLRRNSDTFKVIVKKILNIKKIYNMYLKGIIAHRIQDGRYGVMQYKVFKSKVNGFGNS